jgi:hypothetical protein
MKAAGVFRNINDAFEAIKSKHPIVKDTIEIKDDQTKEFGMQPLLVDYEDEDVDGII